MLLEVADDSLGLQAELTTRNASHGSVLYTGGTSVWNKTLSDGSVAVAMLNTGDFGNIGTAFGDFNISFTAEAVGLRGCRRFTARDLFKGEDLLNGESSSVFVGGLWREVDESSMLLLRLRCAPAASAAHSARAARAAVKRAKQHNSLYSVVAREIRIADGARKELLSGIIYTAPPPAALAARGTPDKPHVLLRPTAFGAGLQAAPGGPAGGRHRGAGRRKYTCVASGHLRARRHALGGRHV